MMRMSLVPLVSHLNPVRLLAFHLTSIEVHFNIIMLFGLYFLKMPFSL